MKNRSMALIEKVFNQDSDNQQNIDIFCDLYAERAGRSYMKYDAELCLNHDQIQEIRNYVNKVFKKQWKK
jgi:hypothetical protein